ncbi:hypothetical protein PT273_01380 [Orbaceae bacterium ESL0727]|nr:hypothetical protein [Orbaceae bacterium ESL0727]
MIGKWFIYDGGYSGIPYREDQCSNDLGSRYRITNVVDLTNANALDWTGGLPGQPNNYQRRIGGGLFSEWGDMNNYSPNGSIPNSGAYFTVGNKYMIHSSNGSFNIVSNAVPKDYLCVTP